MFRWICIVVFFFCCFFSHKVIAQIAVKDSLLLKLNKTDNSKERIDILLNLKDLYESSDANIPYAVRLFEEARKVKDAYALGVAAVPILQRYAVYQEKKDSLEYYLNTLRSLLRNTPEEGMIEYCETVALFKKFYAEIDNKQRAELGKKIIHDLENDQDEGNDYRKVKRLFLTGLINTHLLWMDGESRTYIKQEPLWEEAWKLSLTFSGNTRKSFLGFVYYYLSGAYNQAHDYNKLIALSDTYVKQLDEYYNSEEVHQRRPYLYKDNMYIRCYNQMLRGALNVSDKLAFEYFQQFRNQMLAAKGEQLKRNKIYLFEMSYLVMANLQRRDEAIAFCDSLIRLIETGEASGYANLLRPYRDRAILLRTSNRPKEAYNAYKRAKAISDSLINREYTDRLEDMRRDHDVDKLRLEETQLLVKSRETAFIYFIILLCIVIFISIYYYRSLKKTKRLQKEIAQESRRAQESEQMKSIFINSICRELQIPFTDISIYSQKLIKDTWTAEEGRVYRELIRENTATFTTILDNLLETANLDSLSGGLPLEEVDITVICREEVARLRKNEKIEYRIDLPEGGCRVCTHSRYFTIVVRALLNNAVKFTKEGYISLSCILNKKENRVVVCVADTGCGIPDDKYDYIFERFAKLDITIAGNGLGLPLCRIIARGLYGDLEIDRQYKQGARFIFSIPVEPEL